MSDIMLHGVLNIPPELWSGTPIDVMQRHSRYVQASEYIKELCEQRDKAMCELEMWKDGNIMHEDHKNEIQELEQQRDRLAEAMRIIMADYRLDGRVSAEADMLAREALAAVEGGQL